MPCAGTEGGGVAAIDIVSDGFGAVGYPTYCIVCPDHNMSYDVCYPPDVECFDPFFEECGSSILSAAFDADKTEICAGNMVQFYDESSGDVTSWAWIFSGGDPSASNEQNPVVTYMDAGYWDVFLTVSDGTDFSTTAIEGFIHADPCIGMDEYHNDGLNVYPNPTNGELNLEIGHTGQLKINILNILGENIYTQELVSTIETIVTLDISNFEDGLYFVQVQTENNTMIKKIKLIK